MKRAGLIYTLQDPISKEIRYVGKTVEGKKRFYRDIKPSVYKTGTSHLYTWIRKLRHSELFPIWNIVQTFELITNDELSKAEMYWISYFKSLGCDLCNHTAGGDGMFGYVMSEATKSKLRAINLGKPQSAETKEKRSQKLRGLKRTAESLERYKLSKLGTKNPMFNKPSAKRRKVSTSCGLKFDSLLEASKYMQVTISAIIRSCKHSTKVQGKYKFNYADGLNGN